jgi:hypothetical protein
MKIPLETCGIDTPMRSDTEQKLKLKHRRMYQEFGVLERG